MPSTVRGARGLERTRDYAGSASILPEPTADRLRPSRVSICARGAPRASSDLRGGSLESNSRRVFTGLFHPLKSVITVHTCENGICILCNASALAPPPVSI
eukprot:1404937-Prymnesium_polylepis.1